MNYRKKVEKEKSQVNKKMKTRRKKIEIKKNFSKIETNERKRSASTKSRATSQTKDNALKSSIRLSASGARAALTASTGKRALFEEFRVCWSI